jgi:hypothetical protein
MHDKVPQTNVPMAWARTATFGLARYFSLSMMMLPVILWIWLCRDWPERLGFFSDDWMVLLHPFVGAAEAYHDIMNLVATRPVSAPYIWLAQVIVDWSPVRSQLLNIAMLLVAAVSVGLLAAAVLSVVRNLRTGALIGACIAAATFIVFPSTIGTFAWGTGVSTVIPALPLFCLATSVLVHSANSWRRLGAGVVLAALSHLSYEAFYFQEITIVLLATTLRGSTIREIPWRTLAGAVLVNIACVAFNRLTPGGVQKSFHWDFIRTFSGSYSHILAILGHAVREHKFLIAGTVLVASPSGAICLARLVGASRVVLAFLVIAGGIVVSGLLYASAGYGLVAEGVMARVSIVIATYYSIAAGLLAASAWRGYNQSRLAAIAFFLAAGTGLVTLELAARTRTEEWADVWSYELVRLSRLSASITSDRYQFAGDQRIYVAIDDRPRSFVEPAAAPWEIFGAVAWTYYRATNSRLLMVNRWKGSHIAPEWFAAPRNWFNRWNGHSFEQGFCGTGPPIYSASGSELWLWQTGGSALTKVDAPWEYGCP